MITIILAYNHISEREEELVKFIGREFSLQEDNLFLIRRFIDGNIPEALDYNRVLIISAEEGPERDNYHHLRRKGLGVILSIFSI